MQIVNWLKAFCQRIADMFMFKDEEEDYISMAFSGSHLYERFEVEYDKLLRIEDELREMMNSYAIGNPEVKMSNIDEKFSEMKKSIYTIRQLAIESESLRKGNE